MLALVSRRESWRTLRKTSKTGATPLCIQIGAFKLIRLGAATLSIYGAAVPDISWKRVKERKKNRKRGTLKKKKKTWTQRPINPKKTTIEICILKKMGRYGDLETNTSARTVATVIAKSIHAYATCQTINFAQIVSSWKFANETINIPIQRYSDRYSLLYTISLMYISTMTTLMRVQGTFIDVDASKARYSAASWY